jgi:hypothetical protein
LEQLNSRRREGGENKHRTDNTDDHLLFSPHGAARFPQPRLQLEGSLAPVGKPAQVVPVLRN